MSLPLFLYTDLVLFVMGALGTFLNRRNFIIMLLCIELMLLAANLVFLSASVALDDMNGQLLALWVMTAAAAETALGLALCVLHYRLRATLDVELINLMKGSTLLGFIHLFFCLYKYKKNIPFCYSQFFMFLFLQMFAVWSNGLTYWAHDPKMMVRIHPLQLLGISFIV